MPEIFFVMQVPFKFSDRGPFHLPLYSDIKKHIFISITVLNVQDMCPRPNEQNYDPNKQYLLS